MLKPGLNVKINFYIKTAQCENIIRPINHLIKVQKKNK